VFDLLKKIFIYILCLLPWFISYIIPVDYSYYNSLKLPFFAPPSIFYGIAWTTIYILVALSISQLINTYSFKGLPNSYKITLLINYLFNQAFTIVFFGLKSNFLGFISCLGSFVSCLFLYNETTLLKEKSAKLLNPYIILSLFATVLSLTIYVMNSI